MDTVEKFIADALATCINVRDATGPQFEEFCIHLIEHVEKRIDVETFCSRTYPLLRAHPDLLDAVSRVIAFLVIQNQEIRTYFRGELIRLCSGSTPRSHGVPDLNIQTSSSLFSPRTQTSTANQDQNVHPPISRNNQNAGTSNTSEAGKFKQVEQELHQLLADHEKEGGLTPPLMQKYMSISSQIEELRQPMIDQAMEILNQPQEQPILRTSDTDSERKNSDSEIGPNSKYGTDRPENSGENEQELIGLKQQWQSAEQGWSTQCAQWHAQERAQQQLQQQMTNKSLEDYKCREENTTRNADLFAANQYVNRLFDGERMKEWWLKKQEQKLDPKRQNDDGNTLLTL